MGILISLAVVKLLHKPCGGVPEPQRHCPRLLLLHIPPAGLKGSVEGIGLGRHGKIDHRMGQMYVAFRHPQEMAGLIGRHRHLKSPAVRHPHILAGKPDQPSGDIERILSSLQHPAHPVDSRVRIAVAHGFVQGGNQIIVFFPVLVIEKGLPGDTLFQSLICNLNPFRRDPGVEHRHLQSIQRSPCISGGKPGNSGKLILRDRNMLPREPGRVRKGLLQKPYQILLFQSLQNKHPAPGQKRAVDLKGRILRGGPDQDDAAPLHIGEERILLGLVEPVDLIHEKHGPSSHPAALLRLPHHILDLLDPAGDRAEINKFRPGLPGDDAGKGRLPHPWRPPEDHGRDLILLDQLPQDLPLPQQMLLSHKGIQAVRAHPAGQRDQSLLIIK